jgi:hypothetical protein
MKNESDIYYAYNYNKILKYDALKNKKVFYQVNKLQAGIISRVEKLLVDKFGNVILKGNGIAAMYNFEKKTSINLFPNINLKESIIGLRENKLYVAGRFGVASVEILGKDKVSKVAQFFNVRNNCYSEVSSMQIDHDRVLLNTNIGPISVNLDQDLINNESALLLQKVQYNIILSYAQNRRWANPIDTIYLPNDERTINLDLVNPIGNGAAKFFIRHDLKKGWKSIFSEQLLTSKFTSGQYHHITLLASDDTWRSDPIELYIYIQPTWWERILRNKITWVVTALLIIGFITLIIFITRQVVNRKNKQLNLRQELELKSVYSQINPHFIFNSLNTALFFIKKERVDEAYRHVSKFSHLLRAYISSSRNKYISIADEIQNLNNYIQLQQERFENKFDYELKADPELAIHTINIPSLLLQPIVENAIEHGLFLLSGKGNLSIHFEYISNNHIRCIINDNGIGRVKSKLLSKDSLVKKESYGDALIRDLINIFNKYEKIKISIEYIDKQEPESGTIVILTFKYPQ